MLTIATERILRIESESLDITSFSVEGLLPSIAGNNKQF